MAKDAVLFRLAGGVADQFGQFLVHRGVAVLVPDAKGDAVLLQPRDRIAQRPQAAFFGGAIGGRIIRCAVPLHPIGEMFDQRWPGIGARPVCGPAGRGIDRQHVIAIDAQPGNAIAHGARGKGRRLRSGKARKAADRPLVVDDVHDDGRAIDAGEGAGAVKVALGRRSFAAPGRRDPGVPARCARHRPADRLGILGGQIAGDREESGIPRRIHDG